MRVQINHIKSNYMAMRMLDNANSHSYSKLNKQREIEILNLLVYAVVLSTA